MRITAAGRAAMASADHVGANKIIITRVLVGSGQGPGGAADDARTTLRNQRDAAAAAGESTTVPARIHVRGDVQPTAAYSITEVGLEARVGSSGAPFLFGYWSDDGEVYAAAVTGVTVVIIAAIDIAADAPATVTISGDPAVTVQYPMAFTGLSDTPAGLTAGNYLRTNAAATALVSATKEAVLSDLLAGLTAGRYLRVAEAGGVRSLEAVTLEQIASGMTVRWHFAGPRHVGQLVTTTVATVSGILRGWRVIGSIGVTAESTMRVWWESASGTPATARMAPNATKMASSASGMVPSAPATTPRPTTPSTTTSWPCRRPTSRTSWRRTRAAARRTTARARTTLRPTWTSSPAPLTCRATTCRTSWWRTRTAT